LAILCATYAYYTLGLGKLTGISPLWFGLIGNLLVIVFALFVTLKLAPASRPAAKLVFPVALWTAYATTIVLGEMKFQKLL
jgi:tryptophan-rich sensory protein